MPPIWVDISSELIMMFMTFIISDNIESTSSMRLLPFPYGLDQSEDRMQLPRRVTDRIKQNIVFNVTGILARAVGTLLFLFVI